VTDEMLSVEARTSLTSRGFCGISPWNYSSGTYSVAMINIGNNFISSLEIVSALNSFNLGRSQYHFNYNECIKKYSPKVYLGTIQTASTNWLYDVQKDQTNELGRIPNGVQKSGSCP